MPFSGAAKYVATSTPLELPWAGTTVVDGDLVEFVRALKSLPGADMGVHGSISVAQALLAGGAVDEVQVTISPTVMGRGRRLFDGLSMTRLETVQSAASPTGQLMVHYRVTG